MEEGTNRADDVKNYEAPSLSELDRGFLTDCNCSSLSAEGIHLKPPKGIVLEYSETYPALPASFNRSYGVLSPMNAPSKISLLSPGSTLTTGLSSLVEGQSSTPYERVTIQKPILVSSLDLSCVDLTTSHPPWEISLIKPSVESPKQSLNASKLESTWSPSYRSVPTLAEISSLIWSGTPPGKFTTEEHQKSSRNSTFQDSNLQHAVLELTEEQQKRLGKNLAI